MRWCPCVLLTWPLPGCAPASACLCERVQDAGHEPHVSFFAMFHLYFLIVYHPLSHNERASLGRHVHRSSPPRTSRQPERAGCSHCTRSEPGCERHGAETRRLHRLAENLLYRLGSRTVRSSQSIVLRPPDRTTATGSGVDMARSRLTGNDRVSTGMGCSRLSDVYLRAGSTHMG